MILFLGLITLLYTFLLLFLLYGFHQVPVFSGKNIAPKTTFSIVIPYRNEANNLPLLFGSLRKLKYPAELFEILLIDDASEDESAAMCLDFQKENPQLKIKLLKNQNLSGSPKKDAIHLAIGKAANKFILSTDADCLLHKNWLNTFNSIIVHQNAEVVAGPVQLIVPEGRKRSFLEIFQQLDFFSLQAATIGGFGAKMPFMCNGANFCYSKKGFLEVNGFEGNEEIASGDDVFLLQKFQKKGLKISFLKTPEAIVFTQPQADLNELISQRKRWAGKSSSYKSFFAGALGVIILLMNLSLVAAIAAVIAGFLSPEILFLVFLFKFNTDFSLLYSSAKLFGEEKLMKNYFWASLLYPFFSSYVAIASLVSGYRWKGRQFKK